MRTRVKICGITSVADARAAIDAGADALGLNFYPNSKRCISKSDARAIRQQIPAFVTCVGLFVNPSEQEVKTIYSEVGLDLVQYHGEESAHWCDQIGLPYIKAVRARDKASVEQAFEDFVGARALLVDSYVPGVAGGTGEMFNWSLLPAQPSQALILAGGLTPETVQTAVREVRPYAVDVSSGVESSAGVKSHEKIKLFIEGVKHVDDER